MDRASGLPPTGATARGATGMTVADTLPAGPGQDSPPVTGQEAPGRSGARPAVASCPADGDREIIVRKMNDVVIRRIFAAGLDLHAALGLLGEDGTAPGHDMARGHGTLGAHQADNERRAVSKIWHATDELDHAIRDIRNILFEST
jgi:hypothetical protein